MTSHRNLKPPARRSQLHTKWDDVPMDESTTLVDAQDSAIPQSSKNPKRIKTGPSVTWDDIDMEGMDMSGPSDVKPWSTEDPAQNRTHLADEASLPSRDPHISQSSSSTLLRKWLELEPQLLASLYTREAHPNQDFAYGSMAGNKVAPCPGCAADLNLPSTINIRCIDCLHGPVYCLACSANRHTDNPLHRIEVWEKGHFVRSGWGAFDLKIYLAHGGSLCPEWEKMINGGKEGVLAKTEEKLMTIVHINGVHSIAVRWCCCLGRSSHHDQLIQSGLFPGSPDEARVQSAFSIAVLRHFHLQSVESNQSAYDYFKTLVHLTAGMFTEDVKNRYREFIGVCRVWKHLQSLKRSGHHLGIGHLIQSPHSAPTAILCPACPQPGINMDPAWRSTPLAKRHIHAIFLSQDGNFSLEQKRKNGDPDDFPLSDGESYFVKNQDFWDYLAKAHPDLEVSSCSGFRAGDVLREGRYKNVLVSGVVAVVCARHGFYLPNAMVDLQKGERFSHVDYALSGPLRAYSSLLDANLAYDVACNWLKNLHKRFSEYFPDLVDFISHITALIPKMHLLAHKGDCQYCNSFNFTPHVGRTDGEQTERNWSKGNANAGSTREMNSGHRKDTLNDHHGNFNFQKFQRISQTLRDRLKEAYIQRDESINNFQELSKANPPELVQQWSALDKAPSWEGGVLKSVYKMDESKVPTQQEIFTVLSHSELKSKPFGSDEPGNQGINDVAFVNLGIKIQEAQLVLSRKIKDQTIGEMTAKSALDVEQHQRYLQQLITTWQKLAFKIIPDLVDMEDSLVVDTDMVHEFPVILPSSSPANHHHPKIKSLLQLEFQLRKGQAEDLLQDIRMTLKRRAWAYKNKKDHVRHQKNNTRANAKLEGLSACLAEMTADYNRVFTLLHILDPLATGTSHLQVLKQEDLKVDNALTAQLALGQGKTRLTWIWRAPKGAGVTEEEWATETERVQWFRFQAQMERWIEEVEILEEEQKRVERFFRAHAVAWASLKVKEPTGLLEHGQNIYCHKKLLMFQRMSEEVYSN